MVRGGPVALALVLLVSAAVLTWAHLAVAALSVCLNESPALSEQIAASIPASPAVANWLLPLFGPLGVSPAQCEPSAHAKAMAVAAVAYVLAIVALDRGRVAAKLAWPLVIGVAAVVRIALFFMPGLLSSDIIDYATHGRVASLHAANPYVLTPSQFPSDPLSNLGAWPQTVTVYGPLWTHVDAAVTGLLPNASLVELVFAYKLIGLVADVASAGLLFWLVRRWQRIGATAVTPLIAVAMWLWNPLVNVELIGSAHNESVMIALVLLGLALVTAALAQPRMWLWFAALLAFWLGTLIKFVPLAFEAIVGLAWLQNSLSFRDRVLRLSALGATLLVLTVIVSMPWLDSPAVAAPVVGLASGGQRFKDIWQDAPAAWLTVRVVPLLGVPDDPATLRMDVARVMVYSVTRLVFAAYVLIEAWHLWRDAMRPPAEVLRAIALTSMRVLLLALLLYTSQVYAWYFLWPLPMACLLGPRNFWSRAVIVFGLAFLPAFYLREFEPYGVFEMPRYAEIALAILAAVWLAPRVYARLRSRPLHSPAPARESSEAVRS